MFSKLASIVENTDLQEITGLNTKQMQVLLFLLLDHEQVFSFGELRRRLENFDLTFPDSTLSRSLKGLEEKQLIIWERAPKLQYDQRSKIQLIIDEIGDRLNIQKQIQKGLSELENVKQESKEMNENEIFEELKEYSIKKASTSLYLKLLYANETFTEAKFTIGYLWINNFYELIIDSYIEEIKQRGKKSITEVLHLYYQT